LSNAAIWKEGAWSKTWAPGSGEKVREEGTAVVDRVFALILADLAPGRREEFLSRADRAALNRGISGGHYPSDIAAGKKVEDGIYQEFRKSSAFRRDLDYFRKYFFLPPNREGVHDN